MDEMRQGAYNAIPDDVRDMSQASGSPPRAPEHGTAARQRSRHCRTLVLAAAGAVAAAAALTAALLAAPGSGPPSALAAVTGALAKTSAASYGFRLESTVQSVGRPSSSDVVAGSVDPGRHLAAERLTATGGQHPARAQIRFLGRYEYTQVFPGSGLRSAGKSWSKAPVPPANEMPGTYGFVSDQPVSPGELTGVLQSATTVRDAGSASGPGWAGTKYTFTAALSEGQGSVSGTVYVDRQGQVRRLVTTTTQRAVTTHRDLTLDDYQAPVQVTAPPASQAEYTSTPDWGLYF